MAHLLRITDGTNTVTLSSGDMYIADYVPQVSINGEPITEPVTIGFSGGTATARSNLQAVNRLFVQAYNYTRNKSGARVYVEFDPDTSGTVYRSRLYSGIAELPDDVLGGGWGSGKLEIELTWVRDPFWDGPLTQIPLSNTGSTSSTDAVTVNNANDTGRYNWVDISSSDVVGDMPADIKVEMANSTTDADATDEIYIFHNVYSAPTTFDHFLEGESSTNAVSTTDADANNAAYGAFSWATTTETKIAEWALSSSDLDDAAGGRFAVLARWFGLFPYTDCWLRLAIETPTTYSNLWKGDIAKVAPTTDTDHTRELYLIDTLNIAPYLEGESSIKEIVLSLYALRSSTDNTINIDYLQLSPISAYSGWKRYRSVSNGVAAEETFVHDATEDIFYKLDSGSLKSAEFTSYGGPVQLVPNVDQRLYFNTCDYLGTAKTSQSWGVKLWYRPRRSAL